MVIIGNIDNISKHRIAGWAKNIDNDTPVLIGIYVNDLLIKTVRADMYRNDLEKVKGNGKCAFELNITKSLLDLLPIKSTIKVLAGETSLPYGARVKQTIKGTSANNTLLMEKLNDGFIVNKNGVIVRPIIERGGKWIEKALDDYRLVKEIFKQEFDYDLCIAYGTLLGYIRENGPIGHDDDLDATYISRYEDPNEVVKETHEMIKVFEKYGYQAKVITNGQIHVAVKNGIIVDIFTSWFSDSSFHLYFTVKSSDLKKEDIFPLQEVEFSKRKIYIPNKPEKLLEAIYGDGWMVPDPHFQWRVDEKTKGFFRSFDAL